MEPTDLKLKKLYDEVARMITSLHMQEEKLSREEMHCLLTILDFVVMGKKDGGLIALLKQWKAGPANPEIDDIIKATLLNIDYTDNVSLKRNIETIDDLLRYNKKLRES